MFCSSVDNSRGTHGVQTTNSGPSVNQVVPLQQINKDLFVVLSIHGGGKRVGSLMSKMVIKVEPKQRFFNQQFFKNINENEGATKHQSWVTQSNNANLFSPIWAPAVLDDPVRLTSLWKQEHLHDSNKNLSYYYLAKKSAYLSYMYKFKIALFRFISFFFINHVWINIHVCILVSKCTLTVLIHLFFYFMSLYLRTPYPTINTPWSNSLGLQKIFQGCEIPPM